MLNRRGVAIHEFLMDPIGCLTSHKGMIWSAVLLLLMVVWLRWPRLSADMTTVIPSQINQASLVDEYRCTKPFRVKFAHAVHGRATPRDMGNGWSTVDYASYQKLSEQYIECRYDWMRGEYYARLTYEKDGAIPKASFSGQEVHFSPFLSATNSQISWKPSLMTGDRCFNGCDKSQTLAYDPDTERTEEFLVYAEYLKD